jgi:beta-phosphoglucomutase
VKEYLALFDLDGTLFDTSQVNYFAYNEALSIFGITLNKEYFIMNCNGRHYTEFLPVIMGNVGTKENMEAVHRAKKDTYKCHLNKAKVNTHLFTIIKSMARQYHLAVVTTASRKNTMELLRYYDYEKLFEFIITQEDIDRPKPDPQGFLIAMEKLGMDSKHTIIFEDSEVGLQAAETTGATVFAVKKF